MSWFENEQFWETFYPVLYTPPRFDSAESEIRHFVELSGVREGAVLDLCCGPGRHLKPLAEMGFQVTGVDRSPFLLGKARANTTNLNVELVQADMRSFVRPSSFQLVVNLLTSFGYFETQEEDLAVLRRIKASLAPEGVLLMDMRGKETIATIPTTSWQELPNGEIVVEHKQVLKNWSIVHYTWLLVKPGGHAEQAEFEFNLYSGTELAALLTNAGFKNIELFGDMAGSPYDASSHRLIARACN